MERNTDKPWRLPKSYNLTIDREELTFAVDMAEKMVSDTLDTLKIITDKATVLLNVTLGLFIAIAGFFFSEFVKKPGNTDLMKVSGFACIYLFILSVFIIFKLTPSMYGTVGFQPKKLLPESVATGCQQSERRMKIYLVNVLESYQKVIENNNTRNEKKWRQYKWILFFLILSPLLFLAVLIV